MIMIPFGAEGSSAVARWIRKNSPSNHWNVVRPPRPLTAGLPGPKNPDSNENSISHSPTSASNRLRASGRPVGTSPGPIPDRPDAVDSSRAGAIQNLPPLSNAYQTKGFPMSSLELDAVLRAIDAPVVGAAGRAPAEAKQPPRGCAEMGP
jgi:hypothetical protein